jgi:Cysteine-rich CPXCG
MQTDDDLVWQCQYCGVENTVWIDLTAGNKQDLIEDCRICCRSNRIIVNIDEDENIYLEARHNGE